MSEQLNFKRLGMLIRRHWWENAKVYLLAIPTLIATTAIVIGLWMSMHGPSEKYEGEAFFVIYAAGILILGSVYASQAFSSFSDKGKGIYWLSLPASHLEKLITTIFYTSILFPFFYTACFILVQYVAVLYIPVRKYDPLLFTGAEGEKNRTVLSYLIYSSIGLQAFFLLGSVYFKKSAYIKTLLFAATLTSVVIWLTTKQADTLVRPMRPGIYQGSHTSLFEVRYQGQWNGSHTMDYVYRSAPWFFDTVYFLLRFIWAPVFWVVAWFRLREKQV